MKLEELYALIEDLGQVAIAFEKNGNKRSITLEVNQEIIYKPYRSEYIKELIDLTEDFDSDMNSFTVENEWGDEITVTWYLV